MKRLTKIIVAVIGIILLLMIVGNLGKDKEDNASDNKPAAGVPSDTGVRNLNNQTVVYSESTLPSGSLGVSSSTPSNQELLEIQDELSELQGKINEINSEDLGGLS